MSTKKTVRRPPAKKTGKRKVPTNKQLATKIKRLEHQSELKYHDTLSTTSVWNNITTFILLSNPAQGDNIEERIGEEITAKYLNVKIQARHSTGSANELRWRMIIFWDMQNNGVGPGLTTSVDANTALLDNNIVTNLFLAPLNYRCKQRYHVLMDKVFAQNPQSTSVLACKFIKKNLNLGGAKVKFSGTGSTVTNIPSRALYVWMYAFSTAAADESAVAFSSRLWFTDD